MALNWLSEGMKVGWVIGVFSTLFFTTTTTLVAVSLSFPSCQEKCGNITIPYPFGVDSNCSANSSFTVTCKDSTTPILSSINMEVINISLLGTVVVKQPVSPMNCSGVLSSVYMHLSFKGTPYTISPRYNSLFVFGCNNSVWLRANKTSTLGGCTPLCDADTTERSCNGVNCCQTTIPRRLKEVQYTYKTNDGSSNDNFCGYVFPADKERLRKDYGSYRSLLSDRSNTFAPLSGSMANSKVTLIKLAPFPMITASPILMNLAADI